MIRAVAPLFAVAIALSACGPRTDVAAPSVPSIRPPHTQFVRSMTTPQRLALVERLRERNGREWSVNEEALAHSDTVVDPFVGFLRRAKNLREHAPVETPIDMAEAVTRARAFVRTNADVLGIAPSMLLTLTDSARPAEPSDNAGRAAWAVKLEATYPSKHYESFVELNNTVSLTVFVDDDGTTSSFVNLSKLHPRLTLDTQPGLQDTDARVYANLVGRRVFAQNEDGERIELGAIEPDNFLEPKLTIQISPGPLHAWMTYRLTWLVIAARTSPPDEPFGFFFFFYLVDTDTGEVVQDSPVPTQSLSELP